MNQTGATPYQRKLPSFLTVLGILGVVMLLIVLGDTFLRDPHRHPEDPVWPHLAGDGNIDLGRQAIVAHGCGACHVVPGIRDARGRVGPKLEDLREQVYIAGVLPNTPDNLVAWIQDPRAINPQTAMPNLGVTEREARDIVAYLYSRR